MAIANRRLAMLVAFALGAWPLAAAEPELTTLAGNWRGAVASPAGAGAVPDGDLAVSLTKEGAGFRLRWLGRAPGEAGDGWEPLEAVFDPAEQPGLFAVRAAPQGLLQRMFASPETGNPLNGETMLWARIEATQLVVYSLGIGNDGGYALDRYAWRPEGGELLARYSRRSDLAAPLVLEARLQKASGSP